uniref:Uncharacterized protein n=1 Tax=Anopheles darlingi TaxID=43151 RepID=A0A2M4DKS3_ANODA
MHGIHRLEWLCAHVVLVVYWFEIVARELKLALLRNTNRKRVGNGTYRHCKYNPIYVVSAFAFILLHLGIQGILKNTRRMNALERVCHGNSSVTVVAHALLHD